MKVAVITGASSGIGRSAAVQIARRGAGVILTYSSNRPGAEEAVAEIEKSGGSAVALRLDVGDTAAFPAFRDAVVDALRDTWQRDTFDHLVNNAGFGQMAMFEDTTEELFDTFTRVLLKGPYFLTQTLLPLIADGGSVVNTTSNSALVSGVEAGYSAYATMKGGLTVLTRYMAKEFSARGIRVNSVAPGTTRTRIGDDAFEKFPELVTQLGSHHALGRIGEPDDVGMVVAMLLSEESRWITAQNVEVAGGQNL
ncbi:SDR family oxidoreductase [Streptomyces sp. SID14478]|uniref:SDR family NAD(P)-dependent oxidoreductase n=1 Tax=Streptomyces sp. SID14478 TaxID=2706073 RepID=UPI0013DF9E9D|nr:SDR family oxidoreductase [Streptomyces sp. SID14478]NEB81939.1 SDR family oxidoreductase [Streptomyces sp. SID14478]